MEMCLELDRVVTGLSGGLLAIVVGSISTVKHVDLIVSVPSPPTLFTLNLTSVGLTHFVTFTIFQIFN